MLGGEVRGRPLPRAASRPDNAFRYPTGNPPVILNTLGSGTRRQYTGGPFTLRIRGPEMAESSCEAVHRKRNSPGHPDPRRYPSQSAPKLGAESPGRPLIE